MLLKNQVSEPTLLSTWCLSQHRCKTTTLLWTNIGGWNIFNTKYHLLQRVHFPGSYVSLPARISGLWTCMKCDVSTKTYLLFKKPTRRITRKFFRIWCIYPKTYVCMYVYIYRERERFILGSDSYMYTSTQNHRKKWTKNWLIHQISIFRKARLQYFFQTLKKKQISLCSNFSPPQKKNVPT